MSTSSSALETSADLALSAQSVYPPNLPIPNSLTDSRSAVTSHPLFYAPDTHPNPDPIPPDQSIIPPRSLPSYLSRMQESPTEITSGPSGSTTTGISSTGESKFDRFQSPARDFPTSKTEGWEEAYDRQRRERWAEKVGVDLRGWRGGNG